MISKKISVIGPQCAGKTEVVKIIAGLHDSFRIIKFADPIYGALEALKKPKHRAFMQSFGEMAKIHFGEHVFVELFKEAVREAEELNAWAGGIDILLCDDVRRDYEAEAAFECGFVLIYVDADREIRKRRAEVQGLEFIENHISETEIPNLKKYAEVEILNESGNIEDLRKSVMSALSIIAADVLPLS